MHPLACMINAESICGIGIYLIHILFDGSIFIFSLIPWQKHFFCVLLHAIVTMFDDVIDSKSASDKPA